MAVRKKCDEKVPLQIRLHYFLNRSSAGILRIAPAPGDSLRIKRNRSDKADEHVNRVLPKLREMAAHRLIVRENVVVDQGSLD
jgi:hypothetical protein